MTTRPRLRRQIIEAVASTESALFKLEEELEHLHRAHKSLDEYEAVRVEHLLMRWTAHSAPRIHRSLRGQADVTRSDA